MKRSVRLCAIALGGALGSVALVQGCLSRKFEPQKTASIMQRVDALANTELLDALDVSILIPTEATSRFPMSQFMTETQFQQVIALGQGRGPAPVAEIDFSRVNDLSLWRIVSMRYDPCAPGVHAARDFSKQMNDSFGKDDFCQAQVRLIAQPFFRDSDEDVTMHLLYSVGKDAGSLERQIRSLQAIKRAAEQAGFPTTGLALQIHPGLSAPSVQQELSRFLIENCQPQQIRSVAVMGLSGGGSEPWTFFATRPNQATGELVLAPLPTVDNASGVPSGFQAVSFVGDKRIIGTPSKGENFAFPVTPEGQVPALAQFTREPILNRSTAAIMNSAQGQLDSAGRIVPGTFDDTSITQLDSGLLSLLHSVDNPNINHFFTMDCASCHTSANLLLRRHAVVKDQGATAELALIESGSQNRFQVPPGVTAYVEKTALQDQESFGRPWSLRNFGYFFGEPSIAFRTATETAEVVVDINTEIIGSRQAGPNACANVDGWQAKEPALWTCIQFDNEKTTRQCIAEICGSQGAGGGSAGGQTGPDVVLNAGPGALLETVGSRWKLEHGRQQNGSFKFVASAQVLEPRNHRIPKLKSFNSFTVKFFLKHSELDVSNMGFAVSNGGKTIRGIRYNMALLDPTRKREDTIEMTWNDSGGFFDGTMTHDIAAQSSEAIRLTPIR